MDSNINKTAYYKTSINIKQLLSYERVSRCNNGLLSMAYLYLILLESIYIVTLFFLISIAIIQFNKGHFISQLARGGQGGSRHHLSVHT